MRASHGTGIGCPVACRMVLHLCPKRRGRSRRMCGQECRGAVERIGPKGDDHPGQYCPQGAEWSSPAAEDGFEIDGLCRKGEFDRRSTVALGFKRPTELLGQAADQLQA
jgi:hypothetical protein